MVVFCLQCMLLLLQMTVPHKLSCYAMNDDGTGGCCLCFITLEVAAGNNSCRLNSQLFALTVFMLELEHENCSQSLCCHNNGLAYTRAVEVVIIDNRIITQLFFDEVIDRYIQITMQSRRNFRPIQTTFSSNHSSPFDREDLYKHQFVMPSLSFTMALLLLQQQSTLSLPSNSHMLIVFLFLISLFLHHWAIIATCRLQVCG